MINCEFAKCKHKMLVRCTECGREQYMLAVYSVSHGNHPCVWCGKLNKVSEEK